MSAHTMNRTTQITLRPRGESLRARAARTLKRFGGEFRHALRVIVSRPDVSRLDDRMLKDLGISRAQAEFEASRGPWRVR